MRYCAGYSRASGRCSRVIPERFERCFVCRKAQERIEAERAQRKARAAEIVRQAGEREAAR